MIEVALSNSSIICKMLAQDYRDEINLTSIHIGGSYVDVLKALEVLTSRVVVVAYNGKRR